MKHSNRSPMPGGVRQVNPQAHHYIDGLVSLRGIAAVMVMMIHFSLFFPIIRTAWIPIDRNNLWVDFFFILSGFVITLGYGNYFENGFKVKSYGVFMGKRLLRIYPVHFVTLMAMVLVEMFRVHVYAQLNTVSPELVAHPLFGDGDSPRSMPSFIANLLLVHCWGLHKNLTWNIPSWSISCEFLAYMVFPILVWLLYRTQMVATMFCITMLAYFKVIDLDASNVDVNNIRALLGFFSGMVLYRIYSENPKPWAILQKDWVPALALAVAVFHYNTFIEDFDYIPVFCLLIISVAYNHGRMTKFLTTPILHFLGKISYSLYLVHFVMLNLGHMLVVQHYVIGTDAFPYWQNAGFLLLYLAATFIAATISYYLLELQLPKLFRRRLNRELPALSEDAPESQARQKAASRRA